MVLDVRRKKFGTKCKVFKNFRFVSLSLRMSTARMVPRLRSLCLEKVNNNIDEVDYQTIPKELARDLQLSKLFNGNFAYDDTIGPEFGLDVCALNIFYDGETWTFTYRSENNELYWYHPLGEFRPRLRKFTLTEGNEVHDQRLLAESKCQDEDEGYREE